jgi:hypothetical protein
MQVRWRADDNRIRSFIQRATKIIERLRYLITFGDGLSQNRVELAKGNIDFIRRLKTTQVPFAD